MKIDLKIKKANLLVKFDDLKEALLKKRKEMDEMQEEMIKLQGEYRLVEELLKSEEEEPKDVTVLK